LPPGTRRAAEVRGRTGRKSSGERRIALDDFGAGHYSLRRLWILLVDIVKIDGSLVGKSDEEAINPDFSRPLLSLV
jgi:EAL domain-containing protein (putative c-di-GMP-specific phosphodiesterase class I)